MNFGQIKKIRFILVKIFWSNSNQFPVILILSSDLASMGAYLMIFLTNAKLIENDKLLMHFRGKRFFSTLNKTYASF